MPKKYKYKQKKFTGLMVLSEDGKKIRKMASKRGIPIYQLFKELLDDFIH